MRVVTHKGCRRYFVVLRAAPGQAPFTESELVEKITDVLKAQARTYGFFVWAYCFMPTELRLLVAGQFPFSNVRWFLRRFKERSGALHVQRCGRPLWDGPPRGLVLGEEDPLMSVARFILESPVRTGLVSRVADYEFLGSFELNVKGLYT
jgi:hypothetical protein